MYMCMYVYMGVSILPASERNAQTRIPRIDPWSHHDWMHLIRPIRPIRPIRLIRLICLIRLTRPIRLIRPIRPIRLIADTFNQNKWWGTQIHGGEATNGGELTYMVAWPALVGGQGGAPPGPAPRAPLAPQPGQATMCVGSPPYVASPPCIWVPHNVFWSKVSGTRWPSLEKVWTEFKPSLDQLWTKFLSTFDQLWTNCGPTLDQVCTNFVPTLDQLSFSKFGSSLDQVWSKFGPSSDQVWIKFGPTLDEVWINQKPIRGPVLYRGFRSRAK